MYGDITKQSPKSAYAPSREVSEFTAQVKRDYMEGVRILTKSWVELNDRSIIDDKNRGEVMFNAFVDTTVEDPNEAWQYRGTRSMARNKGIAMHANLTANFLIPLFQAQNENDEIDKGFSEIMRYIIEWLIQPPNSNYQRSFLSLVFAMETSPVVFLEAAYCEIYQKIKEKMKDRGYSITEIIDEILSGFNANLWSSTEVLITNAYERNIQKQRCIIPRRYAEYEELEAKYGEHENWPAVKKGIRSVYNDEDGLFYDVKDDDHLNLVAEETYINRRKDLEICFINGIYMGAPEIERNPIKHRDNRGAPKYRFTPFGFHRIGEHFFYYKSMMNSLGWDNARYDVMDELIYNRAILENAMPIGISGSDRIDSAVMAPNVVVAFEDKDTKVTPLLPPSNFLAGFQVLQNVEKSMADASVNEVVAGQLPDADQKAYNVRQAQANAKKLI